MVRLGNLPKVSPAFVLMVGVVLACLVYDVVKEKREDPLPKKSVKIVGTVVDGPREAKRQMLFTMYVDEGRMKGKKIRCYVPKNNNVSPQLGHRYSCWTKLLPFKNFPTEGHFNYPRWAESHSLKAQTFIRWGRLREVKSGGCLPLGETVALKAKKLQRKLLALFEKENINGEHFSLVAAMAFGDRSILSGETREMFTRTGVAHLLALSGLHLGILYALLALLFIRYEHRVVGSVVVVLTVWVYVFVVGLPASVVRAATMLTLYTLLAFDGSRGATANPLFVAVSIILLVSPRMLWDVGFQMSVLSVWSIACVYKPLYTFVPRKYLAWWPVRALWAMIVVSLSAQLGVAPLIVYYFGNFSYIFLFTNIVAVPLVTLLLYAVFLSLVFWWFTPLRHILLWVQGGLTEGLENILMWIGSMEGVSVSGLSVSEWGLAGMYVVVVGVVIGLRWVSRVVEQKRENNLSV